MKIIIIRPKDVKNCWETEDACIIEQYDNKRWVCEKFFKPQTGKLNFITLRTSVHIKKSEKEDFVEIPLKGKSDSYGQK